MVGVFQERATTTFPQQHWTRSMRKLYRDMSIGPILKAMPMQFTVILYEVKQSSFVYSAIREKERKTDMNSVQFNVQELLHTYHSGKYLLWLIKVSWSAVFGLRRLHFSHITWLAAEKVRSEDCGNAQLFPCQLTRFPYCFRMVPSIGQRILSAWECIECFVRRRRSK